MNKKRKRTVFSVALVALAPAVEGLLSLKSLFLLIQSGFLGLGEFATSLFSCALFGATVRFDWVCLDVLLVGAEDSTLLKDERLLLKPVVKEDLVLYTEEVWLTLNGLKGNGEEFINEVASISKTSHVNIVSLVGFCFEGCKRALVYEFMPNGSLEKFIYEERCENVRQLGWPILYKIALGIARGLEYLHRGCITRILHFDIKPYNILLDEDFCPKISDFCLAKLCVKKESIVSMLGARGTIGYIAPEIVFRNLGGVSHKSDVYSYEMMVLEMVGVRKNVDAGADRTSEIYFPHWLYQRIEQDEELQLIGIMNEEKGYAKKMVMVSLCCIQTDPSNRPSMTKVVEMLEGNLDSMQIPPKPYLYSS
ncbi:putative receptor-like protein kinase [Capsicum annuum]|uniref:Receptor-like protein kinase n=2 Tax=Capsicum annuum TaxID=4072 RepID=A0A2G2YC29_CAPAN|nr:putative receptor-like protein kinase [Capsicum annuum]